MIYQVGENIPFTIVLLKKDGKRDTGKSPTMTLVNNDTGAELLTDQALTESIVGASGIYRYIWTNNLTTNTTLNFFMKDRARVITSGTLRVVTVKQDIQNSITAAKNEVLADILAKKDIIITDALSNKDEILTDNAANTSQISSEITETKTIINENIDDSDGRVS